MAGEDSVKRYGGKRYWGGNFNLRDMAGKDMAKRYGAKSYGRDELHVAVILAGKRRAMISRQIVHYGTLPRGAPPPINNCKSPWLANANGNGHHPYPYRIRIRIRIRIQSNHNFHHNQYLTNAD